MTITAPPALTNREAPTTDVVELLHSGLHWLHDTAQPPCAIIDAHGAVATSGATGSSGSCPWAGPGRPASSSTSPTCAGAPDRPAPR